MQDVETMVCWRRDGFLLSVRLDLELEYLELSTNASSGHQHPNCSVTKHLSYGYNDSITFD